MGAVGGHKRECLVVPINTNTGITLAHHQRVLDVTAGVGGDVTITVPAAGSLPDGFECVIRRNPASASDVILGTGVSRTLTEDGEGVILVADSGGWIYYPTIGKTGADGAPGLDGADGAPGPNEVTTATDCNITGLLKGDGSKVAAAALADVPINGGADIGEALADTDELGVYNASGASVVKTAVSRIWTYIWGKITALAAKSTPVDADSIIVIDSEDGNAGKLTTWTQIKAFLKTYFDTLYAAAGGAPAAHAASHQSGGGDAIKLDDLAAPDDNTDLDASTTKHGLAPKGTTGSTQFWRQDWTLATPAGGTGLTWIAKTANYTAVANDGILADTATTGAFTLTLPATPANGDTVGIIDAKANFAVANLTVARNGEKIEGATNDLTLSVNHTRLTLTYSGATAGWILDVGMAAPAFVGVDTGFSGTASKPAPIDHRHGFSISSLSAITTLNATDLLFVHTAGAMSPENSKMAWSALLALIFPPGAQIMWGGATAPTGWLLCDGAAVSRTTYANLFAEIGTTWGAGDGSTTFNVPDFRGRSPMGVGTGAGGGASGTGLPTGGSALTAVARGTWKGAETHALVTAELAAHNHPPQAGVTGFWGYDGAAANSDTGSTRTLNRPMSTTGDTGSGTAHNNVQPVMGVNFIIKT